MTTKAYHDGYGRRRLLPHSSGDDLLWLPSELDPEDVNIPPGIGARGIIVATYAINQLLQPAGQATG